MKSGGLAVDVEELKNVSKQLMVVGDFVPLRCETETELLVVAVHNQDQPLVDPVQELTSTSLVEVPDNAAQGVVDFDVV